MLRARLILIAALVVAAFTPVSAAHATATTYYIGASGSAGAGSSCASPNYVGGAGIASAVAAANNGDTIIVCEGVFAINSLIRISNKALTIRGTNTAAETILNGGNSLTGIFQVESATSTTIQKLTFINSKGRAQGSAIYYDVNGLYTTATTAHQLSDCIFAQNYASSQAGAVYVGGDAMNNNKFLGTITISNNLFVENSAGYDGAAVTAYNVNVDGDPSHMIVDGNKFLYNWTVSRSAGAIASIFNSLTVSNNYFYMNNTLADGNQTTLYGRMKVVSNIIISAITGSRKSCEIDDLGALNSSGNKVDNANCVTSADTSVVVPSFTQVTRSAALALTGTFIPESPKINSATKTDTTANLTLAVRDTGTANITSYEVSLNGGAYSAVSLSSSLALSGLTQQTAYSILLRAVNANGKSFPSASFSLTTETSTAPSAAELAAQTKAAAQEAERKRQAEISSARNNLIAASQKPENFTQEDVLKAGLEGITEKNASSLISELKALAKTRELIQSDIDRLAARVKVIGTLGEVAYPANIFPADLVRIGVITADNKFKTSIYLGLLKLPLDQRNSFAKVSAKAAEILKLKEDRRAHLQEVTTRIASRR